MNSSHSVGAKRESPSGDGLVETPQCPNETMNGEEEALGLVARDERQGIDVISWTC